MTRKELKNRIKEEQKKTVSIIRILKAARKPKVFDSNPEFYKALGYLDSHRSYYRSTHIAYCTFFNNTPYEKIERKCNESRDEYYINKIKEAWEKEIVDEVVCIN